MGSRGSKQASAENSEEQVNIGLVNVANQGFNTDNLETILEVISFVILAFLVIRWAKKCILKRKREQDMRLANIVSAERKAHSMTTASIVEIPTAPKYDFRAIQGPRPTPSTPQSQSQQADTLYLQPVGPLGLDQYR